MSRLPPHREYLVRQVARMWPRFDTAEIATALGVSEHLVWNTLDRVREIRAVPRCHCRSLPR